MIDAKEITALRKAGKLSESLELGRKMIAEDPDNIWKARAIGWVYYEYLKAGVASIEEAKRSQKAIPRQAVESIHQWLREYFNLPREIPGMLHSKLVFQLSRIGRHLDYFLPFMVWAGDDWYQEVDIKPTSQEEKVYSPLLVKVARECAAWLKARPQRFCELSEFVEKQLHKAAVYASGDDQTWVNWSLALLLRKRGEIEEAAKTIFPILKSKRTEFWVWSEAARIYQEEQPELGIACYSQALCCGAEPKFLGKTHLELATLLAQQGEFDWSSKEIIAGASIYDKEGWQHPKELEDAISSEWFDPSSDLDPATLRKEHSLEALALCFDEVVSVDATFLGMEEHNKEGKKPRPTFAIKWEDNPSFLPGRRANKNLNKAMPGLPVRLTLGIDGKRRHVIEILPRPEGQAWDMLKHEEGVITKVDNDRGSIRVYFGYEDFIWIPIGTESDQLKHLLPGAGISIKSFLTSHTSGRRRVVHWELCDTPQKPDIRIVNAPLDIKKSGTGFVSDIYIHPSLMGVNVSGTKMNVVAIRDLDPKRNQPGWKAIAVTSEV